MKKIELTQGKVAMVDDVDYDWLNQFKWCAVNMAGNFYAMRNTYRIKGRLIPMARQILGLKYGDPQQADHIDHNTLDNRRDNMRICTHRQNQMNRKRFSNSISKYKGVGRDKNAKKWTACIVINKKRIHLGLFLLEKVAVLAYNKVAKKYFGEFAYLNKIP